LLIKKWTKAKGIANTQNSTISSYSWTLLVIHFLLVHRFNGSQSPLLSFLSGPEVDLHQAVEKPNVNLGQLFVEFFIYYGVSSPQSGHDILEWILFFDPTKMFIKKLTLSEDEEQPVEEVLTPPSSFSDPFPYIQPLYGIFKSMFSGGVDETTNPIIPKKITLSPHHSVPGLENLKCAPPIWRLSLIDPLDFSHDVGSCIQRCEGQAFIFNQLHEIVELFHSFTARDISLEDLLDKIFEINPNVTHLPKICSICFSEDHMSRQCPSMSCFACGRSGHGSSDCPNRICFKCRKRHLGSVCPVAEDLIEESAEEGFSEWHQNTEEVRCSGKLLYETVLHWDIKTLMGPSLLPRNTRPIPSLFDSSIEWFNTFFPFIVEDLRCSMKGIVDNFEEDPILLRPLIKVKRSGSEAAIVSGLLTFEIKDARERDFVEGNVGGVAVFVHQYQNGNLLEALLSRNHFFVHIGFSLPEDPIAFECHFPQKSLLFELEDSKCSSWQLIILGTHLSGTHRVCDALGRRTRPEFMKDILRGKVHRYESQGQIGDLSTLENSNLNDSQNLAIERVLLVGLPDHPRIQVIKGPPGMSIWSSRM
jgi:hypothetical protein